MSDQTITFHSTSINKQEEDREQIFLPSFLHTVQARLTLAWAVIEPDDTLAWAVIEPDNTIARYADDTIANASSVAIIVPLHFLITRII